MYESNTEKRRDTGVFSEQDLKRMEKTSLSRAELILKQCAERNIRVLSWADEEYPQRLREIYAPPAVLYVKGSLEGLDRELAITVVGTREAIGYTRGVTGNLCYQMARAGVMGMGVLVTHAPERSGSLITADLAGEQGKEVFCVPPYNIYDSGCLGVVPLLQDGAKPVYSVHSILEEYYPLYSDRIDLKALSEVILQSGQSESRSESGRERRMKVADAPSYRAETPPDSADSSYHA